MAYLKDESGYSLVEVIVSILLLSVAIIPMVTMFDAGLRTAVLGGNYDKGRTLANTKLEEVKALTYSEVESKYPPSGSPHTPASVDGFTFEVTTRYLNADLAGPQTSPSTPYMSIRVNVKWQNGEFTTTGLRAR